MGLLGMYDQSAYEHDNRPSIVYLAVNIDNGHEYVGITRNGLKRRKSEHFGAARRKGNGRFYDAIRKYGEDGFEFSIIETCDTYEDVLRREAEIIAERKPYYNITDGGRGAIGYRHTEATKRAMSEKRKGRCNYWLKGKTLSLEHRSKIVETKRANPFPHPNLGRPLSSEHKKNISAALTGTKWKNRPTPEMISVWKRSSDLAAQRRRRAVVCLDDGKAFISATEAAKAYRLDKNCVAAVCRPTARNKSAGGLRFAYVEEVYL